MSNVRTQIGKAIGKSLNSYHSRVKPKIDELKFKEQYQGRIIDCMVGEVDDNYIETPETDEKVVKLEHSKDGVVKIARIKGKTILVDEEGNETDTPGEGCRLISVGEDEDNKLIILSNNKNLLRKELIEKRTWMDINGVIQQNNDNYVTKFIRVEKNSIYKNNANFTFYWLYDENKEFIGFQRGEIVTTNLASYVKFGKSWSFSSNGEYDFSNSIICKVNHMNDVVEYIPHESHKTEILLDEPLRNLSNRVYDEIVGNKLIRRVGRVVLNGTEVYGEYADVNNRLKNVIGYFTQIEDIQFKNSEKNILCNVMPTSAYDEKDTIGCKLGGSPHLHIYLSRELINSKEDFIDYIKLNPIEVLYELAEPIIEELPNGITLQGYDDTTMYIENSIAPTVQYGYNALIPYKQELLNQKEEVETNTLDIEQNIIPYLMDMEFNLMLMEDE
ncbi:MAG TPA: hypothetical protein K8V90_02160 [Romboutsia timonensis]|uniref:Uncharacterized protein n=1 Tax=Romboutsia timonensis TaxID=1776391 RepID=A0A921SYS5_9FIRM|nr:hypothetical protein [Romboutsia timonensis]